MIMPLTLGLIIAFIGLIYLYKNQIKKAKIFLTISIIWIATISYTPFSNLLISPLENQYTALSETPKDVKYILLLGGGRENRGWEALRLYNQMPNSKIITSGYAGRGSEAEAVTTANILYGLGIPKKDVIIHSSPKDTQEEAIKIKQTLGEEKFILITSAYHMPRALALFKKEGLNPIIAPTDFKIKDSDKALSVPSAYALKKTEVAWHEYLGLVFSKIKEDI